MLGQTVRRFLCSYWDRALPTEEINQLMPDLLEAERPYVLLLIVRAYHSMLRTLGDAHVDKIIPPDIRRDCQEVISGTDDIQEFLRNYTLTFDKSGVHSKKCIPIKVLLNEWMCFKKSKYSKRSGEIRKMTKAEFHAILEVTGAVILIQDEKDKKRNSKADFNAPKYKHRYYLFSVILYFLFFAKQ